MPHSIPILRILPVENLLLHENHDPSRVDSLKERLISEGFLRNPPVVTPLKDGASQYVVLDGANRTIAFKALGIPHVIAQVVEPQKGICLKAWNHVLLDIDTDNFITCVKNIPGLQVSCYQSNYSIENENTGELARLIFSTGEKFTLSIPGNSVIDRIAVLNRFERTCQENGRVDRSNLASLETLGHTYPDFSALVIYPVLEISTVLSNAKFGNLLPAGITRFLVSPRALRVNYPLKELMAVESLTRKNDTLRAWIEGRVTERGIRCYEESTIMFDE